MWKIVARGEGGKPSWILCYGDKCFKICICVENIMITYYHCFGFRVGVTLSSIILHLYKISSFWGWHRNSFRHIYNHDCTRFGTVVLIEILFFSLLLCRWRIWTLELENANENSNGNGLLPWIFARAEHTANPTQPYLIGCQFDRGLCSKDFRV